jgi:hypothetical protein
LFKVSLSAAAGDVIFSPRSEAERRAAAHGNKTRKPLNSHCSFLYFFVDSVYIT